MRVRVGRLARVLPTTCTAFSVTSGGGLTPIAGSPFGTGNSPKSVAFNRNGGLLATANDEDSSVSVFTVSSARALTPAAGSPLADPDSQFSVAFSPRGDLLASADAGSDSVWVFSIGPSLGVDHLPSGRPDL